MGYNDRYRPSTIGGPRTPGPSAVIEPLRPGITPDPKPMNGAVLGEGRGGFDTLRNASLSTAASGQLNPPDPMLPGR